MGSKKRQKSAGLTFTTGTEDLAGLTVSPVPQLTPEKGTRRYKPRARKCANKTCSRVFTPHAKHGRYCSENCRKASYRLRVAKAGKVKQNDPILVVATCEYCGVSFFAEAGKGAKYCSPSHRTTAYTQRREAAVKTLIDLGMSAEKAGDLLELGGMSKTSRLLGQLGYMYDGGVRRWVKPTGVVSSFA